MSGRNDTLVDTFLGPMAPHELTRDDIEVGKIYCAKCGEEVETDGDAVWHRDERLNPTDESDG